ncbi:hypothetical protein BH18GEM1_BH18GEM1_04200 [soil metagenome]
MNLKQALRTGITSFGLLGSAAGGSWAQTGSGHSGALKPPGMVVGKVYDRETGEPLVGGMVVIQETSLGNIANDDGSYFISDVPAGSYRVRADYLGYGTVTQSVRVEPGGQATLDFAMASDVVQTAAVVSEVDREPIPVKPPVKSYTVSSEVQTHIPEAMPQETCRVSTTVHGSYIINGTWQLSASVGGLVCGDQVIECRPVVIRKPQLAAVTEGDATAAEPGGASSEATSRGALPAPASATTTTP